MLFLLTVVHLADYGSNTPDRLEYRQAYETLDECWRGAEKLAMQNDMGELIVLCLEQ